MTEEYEHASIRVEMASDATIRDYFAARAMNALISTIPMQWSLMGQSEDEFHITAQSAYRMADAMLRAREK
ncbi:hypothetical protein [Morganella morganii]|uniref:hypothetical protein n=1 Tax=Morganella morganii TaxID=582 RepID=UPI003EBBE2EE|nr:hypothetical protein [Morganella morganii]